MSFLSTHLIRIIMKALAFSLFSALVLSACGGSSGGSTSAPVSYSGLTTAASIDTNNAEEIAIASAEAAVNSVAQEAAKNSTPFIPPDLPGGVSLTSQDSGLNQVIVEIAGSISIAAQPLNMPVASELIQSDLLNAYSGSDAFCGGSATANDAFVVSLTNYFTDPVNNPYFLNGALTFNALCYDHPTLGEISLDGTVTLTQTANLLTITYTDFTYNDGNLTQSIDMTVSSDYGSVQISATGLTFNCANGLPDAGQITYSGSNLSSGTITFTGCDSITNSSLYDGTWSNDSIVQPEPPAPALPTAGVYSGSWL